MWWRKTRRNELDCSIVASVASVASVACNRAFCVYSFFLSLDYAFTSTIHLYYPVAVTLLTHCSAVVDSCRSSFLLTDNLLQVCMLALDYHIYPVSCAYNIPDLYACRLVSREFDLARSKLIRPGWHFRRWSKHYDIVRIGPVWPYGIAVALLSRYVSTAWINSWFGPVVNFGISRWWKFMSRVIPLTMVVST